MLTDEPALSAGSSAAPLVERLRELHAEMLDAVLSGDRMRDVAAIAARHVRAPVAIVVPDLGCEVLEPADAHSAARLALVSAHVKKRLAGRCQGPPEGALREVPVSNGGSAIGAVVLLAGEDPTEAAESDAVLHLAAMAAMTDLALVESRHQVEDELRGTFLEDLRARTALDTAEVVRRGSRLGCDVTRGALILAGDPAPERTHRFMAAIKADIPGAFVQRFGPRVYAVLPAGDTDDAEDRVVAFATALAKRLEAHAPVGLSSFHANAAELGRAIEEADLVVDVIGRTDLSPEGLADGTFRLLLQMLSSDPDQLDAFHAQTVAPLAAYDERYRSDLVGTLASYLDHDCRVNATAEALFAHRHTVSYRLERIRELTGLDPARYENRERLSLGLKIHRLTRRSAA